MMIIIFLTLSLFPVSLAQPGYLHRQEARSCGLTEVPANIPYDWIESDQPAPQVEASARIWRGQEVNPLDMPWVAQVVSTTANIPELVPNVCTGSLISRWWVITAAHCMYYRDEMLLISWYDTTDHEIRAGPWNLTATGFPWRRRSQNYFVPNDYRQQVYLANSNPRVDVGNLNDIALVLMAQPLNPVHQELDNRFLVNYICLPNRQPDFTRRYRVAGFGNLNLETVSLDHSYMMEYQTNIRNSSDCRFRTYAYIFIWLRTTFNNPEFTMPPAYQHFNWNADNRTVCTTPFDANLLATTCPGDSGGPLSVQRTQPDSQGYFRWELTGVAFGATTLDRQWFISFLNQFKQYGGLPTVLPQQIPQMADLIMPHYDFYWPCGDQTQFNLVMGYEDWLLHIIETESPGDPTFSWLYVASFAGLGVGAILKETVKRLLQPKTPALEAAPGQVAAPGQASVPGQDVEVGQQGHEPDQPDSDAGPQHV